MSESLFRYYQNELVYIRQLAQEFGKVHSEAAGRLNLDGLTGRSVDPHVERLIQAFAFLTARVHHKLDDEFPELTDALLSVLYPHYLAPVPSMALVQFQLDPGQAQKPNGHLIDRHSVLQTQPVDGVPCKYRTGYPVTLWPIELIAARYQQPPFPGLKPPPGTAAALRMEFRCIGELPFSGLSLEKLRFFLSGEGTLIPLLYELIFNHTLRVAFRPFDKGPAHAGFERQGADCVTPVGFERADGLLPYPNQSFLGYRLLTEFFAFPSKYLFFDLAGWSGVCRGDFGNRAEVILYFSRNEPNLEPEIHAQSLLLGATPVINLFEQYAESKPLTHYKSEYRVDPDVTHPRGFEVYSVDTVSVTNQRTGETFFEPFYSFRHGGSQQTKKTFWYASRRASFATQSDAGSRALDGSKSDRGTDVFLRLVDLNFSPKEDLGDSILNVRTTCTNRDLPVLLQQAGNQLAFATEQAIPGTLRCIRLPSSPLRPSLRRGTYWRLISHLSLNHLSLTDEKDGKAALQEMLRLYDFSDPESGQATAAATRQLIDGIIGVSSRRVVGRVGGPVSGGFAKGVEVTIDFDEEKYRGTGAGVFLFASVLERFLALYTSINSFTQLVARSRQREEIIKQWPPRAAEVPLL
jgi:type VI secretion system protein ImpG